MSEALGCSVWFSATASEGCRFSIGSGQCLPAPRGYLGYPRVFKMALGASHPWLPLIIMAVWTAGQLNLLCRNLWTEYHPKKMSKSPHFHWRPDFPESSSYFGIRSAAKLSRVIKGKAESRWRRGGLEQVKCVCYVSSSCLTAQYKNGGKAESEDRLANLEVPDEGIWCAHNGSLHAQHRRHNHMWSHMLHCQISSKSHPRQ